MNDWSDLAQIQLLKKFSDSAMNNDFIQSYDAAQILSDKFFKTKNREGQHTVHAMGHCHIDSGGWNLVQEFHYLRYCNNALEYFKN